jgi:hypothetical protein
MQATPSIANIPAIKAAVIPGLKPSGIAGMPDGNSVNGPQLKPSNSSVPSTVFGNSLSGQIVLTLAGACAYFQNLENRSSAPLRELNSIAVSNLIYSYEVAARRSYEATYNLSNLLQKIERQTKKGGFFITSNAHALIENGDATDWFSINFNASNSNFNYSAAEQQEITRNIKKELLDKAIKQFAILNAGDATEPILPDFLESGASVASNALRKCHHYYCQVGSIVLGTANSIWGKSDAVSNFRNNNRSWATERVNGIEFVNYSGSLTFKAQ